MSKKKNPDNVSVGKLKAGGAVYVAPAGSPLPTDAKSELPECYVCLGCISEDGVTNAQSTESEEFTDADGDVVDSSNTKYTETLAMKFLEAVNPDVLSTVYGDQHVQVTENGSLKIEHTGDDRDELVMVVDCILKKRRIDRLVASRAICKEIGDITRKRSELLGYDSTFTCMGDENGVPVVEYIDEIDPKPSQGESGPTGTEETGGE